MKKSLWILAALVGVFLIASCGTQATPPSSSSNVQAPSAASNAQANAKGSYSSINVSQLKSKLDANETFFLLDVRTQQEFTQDGRIPQAKLIPVQELENRLGELPKDQPIACICRSGNRSQTACDLLATHGFTAINVEGGMNAWKASGFPSVTP